ncbi:arylsulfatase B-like [Amphiura filiformis]|uniref:arylsulfatase B-like n=1 Tax=Amphiura filiformis TaxID=82378 RepID=UPI003B219BCD
MKHYYHCPLVFTTLICLLVFYTVEATSTKPNIIFIVADDLGWNDVSFHGSDQIPTPNIDKLAQEGIILMNYYVSPICTPTRSAIMTGRHPIHTGMQHGTITGPHPYGLPLNETTIAQRLKMHGYSTHMVGKWHLGFFAKEYIPTERGFDTHFGYYLGKEDYFEHTTVEADYWGFDFHKNGEVYKPVFGQYSTEIFTREAQRILQQHDPSQPLFLYFPHQAVHSADPDQPLQAPAKYVQRFPTIENEDRRMFAAMVSAMDDSIGNLTETLIDTGLYNNTVIFFTTDNGGPPASFDYNYANNWPLRGTKNTMWEGGVRGTGFVHSPLLEKPKRISEDMLHVCDWFPTMYSLAGGNVSELTNLDGYDVWDTLSKGVTSPRKEILHNIDPIGNFSALRRGDYKIVIGNDYKGKWDGWFNAIGPVDDYNPLPLKPGRVSCPSRPANATTNCNILYIFPDYNQLPLEPGRVSCPPRPANATTNCNILYILPDYNPPPLKPGRVSCPPRPANATTNCKPTEKPCLFNIRNDPCEFYNIAPWNQDLVKQLKGRIEAWNATAVPPRNKPTDPKCDPKLHGGNWVPWVKLTIPQ